MELDHSDGCVLSDDPTRVDLDVVHGFLTTAYWSPGVSRHTVTRAIAGSVVVGAYAPGGRQVGFARAVTDRATFAWLADVFVLPTHRGRGIARGMVTALLDHPERLMERRQPIAPRCEV